jgi:hypothetical protein
MDAEPYSQFIQKTGDENRRVMRANVLFLIGLCALSGCSGAHTGMTPLPPAFEKNGYRFIEDEASGTEAQARARQALISAFTRRGVQPNVIAPFILSVGFSTASDSVGVDSDAPDAPTKGLRFCKAQTSRMTLVIQDVSTGFRRFRGHSAVKRCKPANDQVLKKMAEDLVEKASAGFVN